jgi:hypothetical protein
VIGGAAYDLVIRRILPAPAEQRAS